MNHGLDISNYSGVPTWEQASCWWDQGIRFVIIGLQNNVIASRQKNVLHDFDLSYYIDLPGRDLSIPDKNSIVYVDIEPGCFQAQYEVYFAVTELWELGMRPGIYGNQTSIIPVLGVSDYYKGLPLMYANYGEEPQDFTKFKPFKGWEKPYIWQWKGTTDLCGVNVDLDVMEDVVVPPAPPYWVRLRGVFDGELELSDGTTQPIRIEEFGGLVTPPGV